MPDFAPGLPDPERFGELHRIVTGKELPFVVQRHLAERSGPHYDVRFGARPEKSAPLVSFATKKEWPGPGGKIMLFQQPLHDGAYAAFEGEILCLPGSALIDCSTGLRPIKDLDPQRDKIQVLAIGSRGFGYYPVKRLYRHVRRDRWIRLQFNTSTGERRTLVCGPNHGIYVIGKGFIRAKDVAVGHSCFFKEPSDSSIEGVVAARAQQYHKARMMSLTKYIWNKMVHLQLFCFAASSAAPIPCSNQLDGNFFILTPFGRSGENTPSYSSWTSQGGDTLTLEGSLHRLATGAENIGNLVLRKLFFKVHPAQPRFIVKRGDGRLPSFVRCFVSPLSKIYNDLFSRFVSVWKTLKAARNRRFCQTRFLAYLGNRETFMQQSNENLGVNFSLGHVYTSFTLNGNPGVNSVKIIKTESFLQDAEAFDLLVEDAHNYFADGLLVHNSGYGKGTVKTHEKGRLIVTEASPDKIKFVLAHKKFPETYTMVRRSGPPDRPRTARQRVTQGGSWLLINTTPMDAAKFLGGEPEQVGLEKMRYVSLPADEVDKVFDGNYLVQEKVDGASMLYHLLADRIEAISYRASKDGRPIIHTYRVFGPGGGKTGVKIPTDLRGTILRGEIYGERAGKTIPPQELGGILNASTVRSLEKQREQKVKLKHMLFDVVRLGEEYVPPVSLDPEERMRLLGRVSKHLPPSFHLPETASEPEAQRKLYERIAGGKHPRTAEGIVAWPKEPGKKPVKVKVLPEADVWVRGVFPGKGRLKDVGAGGFEYSISPEGPIVGRVGTGFEEATRREMLEDEEEWIGRLARIRSQGRFPGGAHRAPAFLSLHEDYPMTRKAAAEDRSEKKVDESVLDAIRAALAIPAGAGAGMLAGGATLLGGVAGGNLAMSQSDIPITKIQQKQMADFLGAEKVPVIDIGRARRGESFYMPPVFESDKEEVKKRISSVLRRGLSSKHVQALGEEGLIASTRKSAPLLAHEMGHGSGLRIKHPLETYGVGVLRLLGGLSPFAAGGIAAHRSSGESVLGDVSSGIGTGALTGMIGHSPTLLEEAGASLRGSSAMSHIGLPAAKLWKGRLALLGAYLTYLAGMTAPSMVMGGLGAGVGSAGKILMGKDKGKGKDKEKTDRSLMQAGS